MSTTIEVRGLQELTDRMAKYPEKIRADLRAALSDALKIIQETVPPYPPPPEGSTYVRTEKLGKSLGSGFQGGAIGQPDIFVIKEMGANDMSAQFGTKLSYAPYVIDETQQAAVHAGRWWTMKVLAEKAQGKIEKLFQSLADKLAAFLDRGG